MSGPNEDVATIHVLDRRAFVLSAASAAAFLSALRTAGAQEAPPQALERSAQFEEAYAALLAGATPVTGKVTLELPEIAENGNFVPLTVVVDNPMTQEDHVTAIHVLSTSNPVARVVTFHLSPINGAAKVQSRMRLAKTQEVVALARLSGGAVLAAAATVKVTIGGCSS